MLFKKGADVFEITLGESGERFLVKVNSTEGKQLTKALEKIVGSPALDDHKKFNEDNYLALARYRLLRDTKVSTEQE